jgi:hypothetical protein
MATAAAASAGGLYIHIGLLVTGGSHQDSSTSAAAVSMAAAVAMPTDHHGHQPTLLAAGKWCSVVTSLLFTWTMVISYHLSLATSH